MSLGVAHRTGALQTKDLKRVTVDTTVQEKAIAFPTDAKLMHRARENLVRLAKRNGVSLRQSYTRLGKRALIMQGRYRHAILAGAGYNYRLVLKWLRLLFAWIMDAILGAFPLHAPAEIAHPVWNQGSSRPTTYWWSRDAADRAYARRTLLAPRTSPPFVDRSVRPRQR